VDFHQTFVVCSNQQLLDTYVLFPFHQYSSHENLEVDMMELVLQLLFKKTMTDDMMDDSGGLSLVASLDDSLLQDDIPSIIY